MHQQCAVQIRSSVFFPASAVRVKEQSNTMTKRSETNMLFWHICHLGCLKRAPPAGDVCDSVCVMNCAGIFAHICCGYFKWECISPAYSSWRSVLCRRCITHICSVCMPLSVWIHEQCRVLLCLKRYWVTGAFLARLDSPARQRL